MKSVQAYNFASWRNVSRTLLKEQIPPEYVYWGQYGQDDLFGEKNSDKPHATDTQENTHKVSKQFLSIATAAACYRDPKRWSVLYRILWRLTHNEPYLLSVSTDPDIRTLHEMAKAVSRDNHKMKAFVRFRKTESNHYIAWHEPSHLIVERAAPFFARRFNTMTFSILTPDACAHWNQESLTFSEGVNRSKAPSADELETLWKTFYRHIFNPARIKVDMMKSEMPMKFWHTLPETELIPDMLADAPRRVQEMIKLSKQ